eukprot:scaffold128367_cov31-Tisochrysis_lutea.AAC.4
MYPVRHAQFRGSFGGVASTREPVRGGEGWTPEDQHKPHGWVLFVQCTAMVVGSLTDYTGYSILPEFLGAIVCFYAITPQCCRLGAVFHSVSSKVQGRTQRILDSTASYGSNSKYGQG